MKRHLESPLTSGEYRGTRVQLGLTQEQLAYETGTTLSTIKHREAGEVPVRREAQLAMRWLLANPPQPPPRHVILPKAVRYTPGDQFGLFTVTRVIARKGMKQTRILEIRCRCGKERAVTAASLSHHTTCGTTCGTTCPAHAAMAVRGSHVNPHGDIIDKDGFPES